MKRLPVHLARISSGVSFSPSAAVSTPLCSKVRRTLADCRWDHGLTCVHRPGWVDRFTGRGGRVHRNGWVRVFWHHLHDRLALGSSRPCWTTSSMSTAALYRSRSWHPCHAISSAPWCLVLVTCTTHTTKRTQALVQCRRSQLWA